MLVSAQRAPSSHAIGLLASRGDLATEISGETTTAIFDAESFRTFIGLTVAALEVAAAVVIVGAASRALYRFGKAVLARALDTGTRASAAGPLAIHLEFGRFLLLALDFTIGSDVLKLSITPTFQDVSIAAAVVGVRVVLTLLLRYELSKTREEAPTSEGGG